MFASRLNNKLPKYVSWRPDPSCFAVDAVLEWEGFFPYCFPPFSIIPKVLNHLQRQQVKQAIVVAPMWTTQAWFPIYTSMMVSLPMIFPATREFLYHPSDPSASHALADKMKLMVALLSADASICQAFHRKLYTLSCNHGDVELGPNMREFSENGTSFVARGMKIPFLHMQIQCCNS